MKKQITEFFSTIKNKDKTILFLFILLSLFFIYESVIINRSFTYDEIYCIYAYCLKSIFQLMNMNYFPNNQIFYSIISNLFIHIFGLSEFTFRLPSLIFSILTIIIFFSIIKKIINEKIAFLSCIILMTTPYYILYSSLGRGYITSLFFSLLSYYLFLKFNNEKKWIYLIFLSIAIVLNTYTHLFIGINFFIVLFIYSVILLFNKSLKLSFFLQILLCFIISGALIIYL